VLFLAAQSSSAQTGFTDAEADGIKSFLEQNFGNTNAGMVVGLVDEVGTRIVSAGKLDNVGFDKNKLRGVVVLANQKVALANTYPIGWRILQQAPLKGMEISAVVAMQEFVGAGIALDLDKQTRALRVTRIFPNTPASQAGISAGLIIQRINGVATAGKSLAECMELSPGGIGTKVQMELVNAERKQTNTIEVTKQKFLVSSK